MKIYISGPISGLDLEEAQRKFNDAERYLSEGNEVVNPISYYKDGKKWEDYIIDDLQLLKKCDAIYVLRGWQRSVGAKIEYAFAKKINLKIISQR